MGRWGMGISSSDEFADVVDEYFELFYYTTKPLAEIEAEILQNYKEEYSDFEPDDGVWHDVYFALADCGWKCGYIGENVISRVDEIISKNLDIEYMKGLDAASDDLKMRAKVLDKFLIKIKSKNEKPVQRKLKLPFINPFKTGDVFAYKYKGFYYGGVVLQVRDINPENTPLYKKSYNYCIVIADLHSARLPAASEIINSEIRFAEWLTNGSLPKKGFTVIDNIADRISKDYIGYLSSYYYGNGFGIYGIYDVPLLSTFTPEYIGGIQMERYELYGKHVKYLFDTSKMLKTEQVMKLPYN